MKDVRTIPATADRFTAEPIRAKRRVAAYARVSTDMAEQMTSLTAQVAYYTAYISSRPDWEPAGIYTDEGITGTSVRHRDGFNRMIADALDGRIDLIITKSVSRFARNTVDSLTAIRRLKEAGTECYFEKENISTFDGKGELLLTIMSSIAQEEARSISENCIWGQRRRFADGRVTVPFKSFLGFDRGADGNLVINEEQARLVRRIYGLYLEGNGTYTIANILTGEGIPAPAGGRRWYASCIRSILTNEKYKGDALLQKTYTADFLTKQKRKNNGELPQYYVRANHEPIIAPAVFDEVGSRIGENIKTNKNPFSGKIICGACGSRYRLRITHSNDKYRRELWHCPSCSAPSIGEGEIKRAFVKAVNELIPDKAEFFAEVESVTAKTAEFDKKTAEFMTELKNQAGVIADFNASLWRVLVRHALVTPSGDIEVVFYRLPPSE